MVIQARDDEWLEQFERFTSWLVRWAAGSVRQLSIDISSADVVADEAAQPAGLITGALAVAGVSGTLRDVTVRLGYDMPLPLGGWAAALHGLQRLSIHSNEGCINVSGNLRGLTALQSLEQLGSLKFMPTAQLPLTLTSLSLGCLIEDAPLPRQVG